MNKRILASLSLLFCVFGQQRSYNIRGSSSFADHSFTISVYDEPTAQFDAGSDPTRRSLALDTGQVALLTDKSVSCRMENETNICFINMTLGVPGLQDYMATNIQAIATCPLNNTGSIDNFRTLTNCSCEAHIARKNVSEVCSCSICPSGDSYVSVHCRKVVKPIIGKCNKMDCNNECNGACDISCNAIAKGDPQCSVCRNATNSTTTNIFTSSTKIPSSRPSIVASTQPSVTAEPSSSPSRLPSRRPSSRPSARPSQVPSADPTSSPTLSARPTVTTTKVHLGDFVVDTNSAGALLQDQLTKTLTDYLTAQLRPSFPLYALHLVKQNVQSALNGISTIDYSVDAYFLGTVAPPTDALIETQLASLENRQLFLDFAPTEIDSLVVRIQAEGPAPRGTRIGT